MAALLSLLPGWCYSLEAMPIRHARELSFAPPPHCRACGVGIVAYGLGEPVAVDADGHPYCRAHGHSVEPTYPVRLAGYRAARQAERERGLRALEDAADPHAAE
jgi:hypothetical protein